MNGSIRRGTTPTLRFSVPWDTSQVVKIYLTFVQEGSLALELDVADVMLGPGTIWCPLQQADTLALSPGFCSMQVRALLSDGATVASDVMVYRVEDALKGGVLS